MSDLVLYRLSVVPWSSDAEVEFIDVWERQPPAAWAAAAAHFAKYIPCGYDFAGYELVDQPNTTIIGRKPPEVLGVPSTDFDPLVFDTPVDD